MNDNLYDIDKPRAAIPKMREFLRSLGLSDDAIIRGRQFAYIHDAISLTELEERLATILDEHYDPA